MLNRNLQPFGNRAGFQPVSGQTTRHPLECVMHGSYRRYLLRWTKKTGWKPILQYALASSRWVHSTGVSRSWDIARQSGDQCKIGFQPVSGQTTRHPLECVTHGSYRRYLLTWRKKTGWKPILQCALASSRWVDGAATATADWH
jgi:hypothetical protein